MHTQADTNVYLFLLLFFSMVEHHQLFCIVLFFLNIICWDNFQITTKRTSSFSFLAEWYSIVWAHCKYFPSVC